MNRDTEHDDGTGAVRANTGETPDEVAVYKARSDVTIDGRASSRGFDIPATLAGFLAALGTLLLLGGLLGAILGGVGYQMGLGGNREELSVAGLIAGLITLFVAFFIGGWVAARIARHHGVPHALMTVVWMVVVAALLAALGAWLGSEYDVFSRLNAPQFFSSDALTTGAIVSALAALAAMLLGAFLGGRVGERSGRIEEAELVETRRGVATRGGGILQRRREGEEL